MIRFDYEEVCYGSLIKRPSKHIKSPYVGDIQKDNNEYLAHCPSLGLGEILKSGSELLLTPSTNPKSKTNYIIEAVKENETWVGNVPLHANRLVKKLIENNKILDTDISYIKPEHSMGDSRIDFYVKDSNDQEHFIEVKSVHIKIGNSAVFPVGYKKRKQDTVSERANKHVQHMTHLAKDGKNAYIIFVVQRDDCEDFRPYHEKDPLFASLLKSAREAGVNIMALECKIDSHGLEFLRKMDVYV